MSETIKGGDAVGVDSVSLKMGLSVRLRKLRESLANSQPEMDVLLGIGKKSWQRYESGGHVPGSQVIAGLVRMGFNANWVLIGEGPMRMDELLQPGEMNAGRIYVPIPRYIKKQQSREVEVESEIASLALSRKWLEQKGLSPVDLVYMRMPDDSMQPTIHEGGVVVIDSGCDKLRGDGIYALHQQATITVKRLQPELAGGGVYVISDNPSYREQRLTPEQAAQLNIIGRVVWVGGEV